MTTGPLTAVLGRVRGLFAAWNADDLTDGQLLEAYVARHDAAAFAVLLRRHGPLVLNVCRGVLHNEHDAEDAFQASFLILARKAGSIRRLASVGGWLYQVAHNVALKARAARRPELERQVPDVPASDPLASLARRELCEALTQEMQRLPEKYRTPLVLCYLENLTTGEAAQRLHWPAGTVKVRLMQGRELLRKRLGRRGFELPVVGLMSLLVLRTASAAAPAALIHRTAQAAALLRTGVAVTVAGVSEPVARLVEGSLLALQTSKLKGVMTGLLVVALFAAGAGGLMHQSEIASGAAPQAPDNAPRSVANRQENRAVVPESAPFPVDVAGAASPLEASVRLQQETPVVGVGVSPDGKLLASAGTDGRIIVWDLPARQRLARIPAFDPPGLSEEESRPPRGAARLAFTTLLFPDNRSVAAGVWDGSAGKTVIVWEASTGRRLRSMSTDNAIALPGDGRTVALAEDTRTVQLRDAASGQVLQRFPLNWDGPIPGPRDGLVFSPDGALVTVGGSWDGTVPLWEVRTGRLRRTLVVSTGLIHSVAISPDGKTLIAAARDESIRVLDLATGKTLHTISRPHSDAGITTVGFAPDGKTLVSGGTDGTICCWPLP